MIGPWCSYYMASLRPELDWTTLITRIETINEALTNNASHCCCHVIDLLLARHTIFILQKVQQMLSYLWSYSCASGINCLYDIRAESSPIAFPALCLLTWKVKVLSRRICAPPLSIKPNRWPRRCAFIYIGNWARCLWRPQNLAFLPPPPLQIHAELYQLH